MSRPIQLLARWQRLDGLASVLAKATERKHGRVVEELRGRSLGHPLHPALTDLPIGFWTSAMLLDLTSGRRTSRTANALVGWGLVSAVPTIITGLTDVPRLPRRSRRVVAVHAAANAAATVGYLGSWLIRRDPRRHTLGMYVSFAAGTAASAAGYLGGWLAQSPDASRVGDEIAHGVRHGERSRDAGDPGAELVASRLNGRRVATGESCTAGRIATSLATVPGAADFLAGSVVAYFDTVKRDMLGVTGESMYTPEAAIEMAEGVCLLLNVECGVATTGVAGGDPQDGVDVGTVFVATSVSGQTHVTTYRFDGDPEEVCAAATRHALSDLAAALERRTD